MSAALALFDYRIIPADDRAFVKEREVLIRETAKRTAEGIVRIGQWLTEVKDRMPHGSWLPWLKTEFAWTEMTACRFMQVHARFKSNKLLDLTIDVSALYLIAAPSTPAPVVEQVIERARNGEPMTRAKAVEVLEDYKRRAQSPPTAVARQIADATGLATADATGHYRVPGFSAEKQRAEDDRIKNACAVVTLIESLQEFAARDPDVVAQRLNDYECDGLRQAIPAVTGWLTQFFGRLKAHGKID